MNRTSDRADAAGEPSARTQGALRGIADALPVIVATLPFGLLFGAVAVQNGLTVWEATFMSAALFAGASQLVGLDLYGSNVPAWLIVLSIFAVNFRHILYSASLGPKLRHWKGWQRTVAWFFLTDPQYSESERRAERGPVSFSWYLGIGVTFYAAWVIEAYVGAHFGSFLSEGEAYGLDFILPLYFFAMLFDFRSRRPFWPIVAASATGAILAILTIGSPWHVSVGALCGVAVAAAMPPKRFKRAEAMTEEMH